MTIAPSAAAAGTEPSAVKSDLVEVAADQKRGVEQTLLTFPEWYLVHSPAEYAVFVQTHPAHEFPFLTGIGQLWSTYGRVALEQHRDHYPMNPGYHVMILVIASSTTAEYLIRRVYEDTFGRISWALSSEHLTGEDRYGAVVAQDYVDFIRQEPWYLYDFTAKLEGLWTTVPVFGPDIIRKLERRFALSSEYLVKAVYGKLIEKATRAAYTPAQMTTEVVVDHVPERALTDPRVKVVSVAQDGEAVMDLPRYFDFRNAATALAMQNVNLVDIAGNRSEILVSIWIANSYPLAQLPGRVLFLHPVSTVPGQMRVGLIVPVNQLSSFLRRADAEKIKVEHVYDY